MDKKTLCRSGLHLQEVDDAKKEQHVLLLSPPILIGIKQGLGRHGSPQLGLGDAVQALQLVPAPAPAAAAPAQEV